MILDVNGRPASGVECLHSGIVVEFDEAEARKILGDWQPKDEVEFVMGNPAVSEVRKLWPRFDGRCPDCGQQTIKYASAEHYALGDW